MKIFFMRHGDHENNILSENGKEQIVASSHFLMKENIKVIYASTTPRCQQTAQILANCLNLPIQSYGALKERDKLAQVVTEEDKEWFDNYMNVFYSHPSKPEGTKEFFERVRNCVKEIILSHNDDENIVIVGHSSNAYAIATLFYETYDTATWIALGNGSVLTFEYFKGNKLYDLKTKKQNNEREY